MNPVPLYLHAPATRVWREFIYGRIRRCRKCRRETRGLLYDVRTGKKFALCEACAFPAAARQAVAA